MFDWFELCVACGGGCDEEVCTLMSMKLAIFLDYYILTKTMHVITFEHCKGHIQSFVRNS